MSGVDPAAVYQLRRFRWENTPRGLGGDQPTPQDPEADAQEVRSLLLFAAGLAQQGDLRLPRTLEAVRVIRLVPEDVGAALFEGIEP